MRVLHCCLAAFYIDNYSYQENVLPQMHKMQGHDVAIVASTETYINTSNLGYVEPSAYSTKEGIPITRLPYVGWIPHFVAKKLRVYKGLNDVIHDFSPDIIFLHDCQFLSINVIASYVSKHNHVTVYVDSHTDFINSARSWLSKNILHGIIYKYCAHRIEPYTRKFYGVLPLRVEFLKNVYKLPANKIELLVMGADDTKFDLTDSVNVRLRVRSVLGISESDFVVISGGKIDSRKNIHVLMRAIREINHSQIKLIIFGAPDAEMEDEISRLSNDLNIRSIGWIASENIYEFLIASDLGVFPGTHSVLWEQAVGVGLPCIFKKWDGIQHIDLGGNCLFLEAGSMVEIKNEILGLFVDKEKYMMMKSVASGKGIGVFSYYSIAERSIAD